MDQQRQERIKKITQSIIGLPTLPTVITQMIGLIDNPKTSAKDVAGLISTDQALTAKILKLANSAFYGFPREIATVNHAVVVLGFDTVKNLGLSVSVLERFAGASGILVSRKLDEDLKEYDGLRAAAIGSREVGSAERHQPAIQ